VRRNSPDGSDAIETIPGPSEVKLVAVKGSGVPYEAPVLRPRVVTDEEALVAFGNTPSAQSTAEVTNDEEPTVGDVSVPDDGINLSTPLDLPRAAYSPDETAALLGCSRGFVYQLMKHGKLRSLKVSGRRLIPANAVSEMLDQAS
jgi:excisionase family DNA binding protein